MKPGYLLFALFSMSIGYGDILTKAVTIDIRLPTLKLKSQENVDDLISPK